MTMMHPERMERVSIIAPKSYLRNVVEKLYELGVCHIEEHKKTDKMDICSPLPEGAAVSEMLINVRAMHAALGLPEKPRKHLPDTLSKDAWQRMRTFVSDPHREVVEQTAAARGAMQGLEGITQKERLLDVMHKLKLDPAVLGESEHLSRFIGSVEDGGELRREITRITRRFELHSASGDDGRDLVALFIDVRFASKASEALARQGFIEIDVGDIDIKKGLEAQRRLVAAERKKCEERLRKTQVRLDNIRREHGQALVCIRSVLEHEAVKAEAPVRFGATKDAAFLTGWVPAAQKDRLQAELEEVCEKKVSVQFQKPGRHDAPPVKLKNKGPIKSFESLLKLYELPRYDEFDPTTLMFITFPLFFAFMLGDVGYGIVTIIMFTILYKKLSVGKALLKVMIFASLVTILFGFAFGEYFGFEHVSVETGERWCEAYGICLPIHEIGEGDHAKVVADFPRLLNRAHAHFVIGGQSMLAVLVIGVLIGFVHLNFGLLLGFLNELHHGVWTAFTHKLSWIVMEAGVILLALSSTGIITLTALAGWAVLALGVVLVYLGEGVQGLVELPAIWSNMLSYVRLGAVGLAGVGLAAVVNESLAMPFIEKGGAYIFAAILVMIIGHAINIALGVIGPFLHSVRLHYVEFFGKFFHGAGRPFTPFGAQKEE